MHPAKPDPTTIKSYDVEDMLATEKNEELD